MNISNSYYSLNLILNLNIYIKYRSLSKRWIPYRQYYVWYFTKRFINFSMNKRCLITFWPTPIWMLSLVANMIQRLFEHISLTLWLFKYARVRQNNNDCVCEISHITVLSFLLFLLQSFLSITRRFIWFGTKRIQQ